MFGYSVRCPARQNSEASKGLNGYLSWRYELRDSLEMCKLRPRSENDACPVVLAKRMTSNYHYESIVEGVVLYGTHKAILFGVGQDGYFIIPDVNVKWSEPRVHWLERKEDWEAYLGRLGVPKDQELKSPESIASRLPDKVLRPWAYVRMGGALGLTDHAWNAVIAGTIFFGFCMIGFWTPGMPGMAVTALAVIAGAIVGVLVEQIEAIGAIGCLRIIGMSLTAVGAAWLGRGFRLVFRWVRFRALSVMGMGTNQEQAPVAEVKGRKRER